ncbi:MAG: magnesium transporter [Lachnospiraceae bacterium]|nr:magnesium transporter [Lachnospiraceae bacterium]
MEEFKTIYDLISIIENQDKEALDNYIEEREPIDFAQEVSDLEPDMMKSLLQVLDENQLASLMEQSDDRDRIRIAHNLDNDRLLVAFSYMQKDDIVDMLGDFPIGRRKTVVNLMKASDRKIISELLQYPEDSAGGIMTTAYIAIKEDLSVYEGFQKIIEIGPKTEVIETIFVINDKRQLVGVCDLRDLLNASRTVKIKDVMNDHVISVEPEVDQEEVARMVSRYDLDAIPVVTKTNQIVGIVTVDDIIDVIVEEYDEDILQLAGVSKEESMDSTLLESVKMRLPWLFLNLLTAFLASFTVKLFESTIEQVVALSAIMTIVSGMGGNAGTQTMSILVRELSQEDIDLKDSLRAFGKELMLGVVNGAATGAATGIIVALVYNNPFLGLIVLLAMIGNLVVAGLFGFLVPVILKKIHADPAIASSIFVTTATDVLGFFIFLGLSNLFLGFLV